MTDDNSWIMAKGFDPTPGTFAFVTDKSCIMDFYACVWLVSRNSPNLQQRLHVHIQRSVFHKFFWSSMHEFAGASRPIQLHEQGVIYMS
jgi:hypothetical protein